MEEEDRAYETYALYAEIEKLREDHGDDEAAHGVEDSIIRKALRLIADGHPDAVEIAREVLTLAELDFHRWTA